MGLIKVRDTYPFGVDPAWHGTRSELPYLNSLKMKMSILLGVAQMNLGIILSFFNAKFFRSAVNIWLVCAANNIIPHTDCCLRQLCCQRNGLTLIYFSQFCSQSKF